MSELLGRLVPRFEVIAEEMQALTFMPRAIELQEAALESGRGFLAELAQAKKLQSDRGDAEVANTILAMELAIQCVQSELAMWVDLKRDRPEAAWDHLVAAQNVCQSAIAIRRQLKSTLPTAGLENLYRKLMSIEQVVFPPQLYLSVGGCTRDRECSICRGNYDECDHIKGRAYLGEVCHVTIRHVELEEVSLVEEAADKRCRVTSFSVGGRKRNRMTWRFEG
jgi:hypothetical protein